MTALLSGNISAWLRVAVTPRPSRLLQRQQLVTTASLPVRPHLVTQYRTYTRESAYSLETYLVSLRTTSPPHPLVCLIANIQEFTVYNPELFLSSFKSTEYSYCALVCALPPPYLLVAMAKMILRFETCHLTFMLSSLSLPPNLTPEANTAIT